jgi:hypothetical protein
VCTYISGSSVNEQRLLNPPIISIAIWMDEYTDNKVLFDEDKEDEYKLPTSKTGPRYPTYEEQSVNWSEIEVKRL